MGGFGLIQSRTGGWGGAHYPPPRHKGIHPHTTHSSTRGCPSYTPGARSRSPLFFFPLCVRPHRIARARTIAARNQLRRHPSPPEQKGQLACAGYNDSRVPPTSILSDQTRVRRDGDGTFWGVSLGRSRMGSGYFWDAAREADPPSFFGLHSTKTIRLTGR